MKKQILAFGLCLFSISVSAQMTFNGQLKNAKSDVVLVEKPFDGKYLPSKLEKVKLSNDGKFAIKLSDNLPGFLLLRIDGQKLRVFVQPGKTPDALVADMKNLSGSLRFSMTRCRRSFCFVFLFPSQPCS